MKRSILIPDSSLFDCTYILMFITQNVSLIFFLLLLSAFKVFET